MSASAVDAHAAVGVSRDAWPGTSSERKKLVASWLGEGLRVHSDAGDCAKHEQTPALVTSGSEPRVQVHLTFDCPSAGTLTLLDEQAGARGSSSHVLVRIDADEGVRTVVLDVSTPATTLTSVSTAAVIVSYVVQGALHLLSGADHLLFLLLLLLPAACSAQSSGWRPAARRTFLIVSAFTLGHSATLVLASTVSLGLSSRWVETAIAASIVVAALPNIRGELAGRDRPLLGFAFGLVHGFGFSSVLAELGLPTAERIYALAAFNVGIELAQLGCVALLMLPLAWAASRRGYRFWALQLGSGAVAAVGCMWMVERALL